MKKIDVRDIQGAARILRVIGHPTRLRIVEALERSSKNVKELMWELKSSQVSVSRHLAVLKKQGIVRSEPVSNFRHYSIAYPNVIHVLNCLRAQGRTSK